MEIPVDGARKWHWVSLAFALALIGSAVLSAQTPAAPATATPRMFFDTYCIRIAEGWARIEGGWDNLMARIRSAAASRSNN